MWYFISVANPDVKYTLLIGQTYIVGRKDCDIIVTGDAAVSRRHAQIQLHHPESNLSYPDRLPLVILKDLSKFGTWVGGQKMEKDAEKNLVDGGEVIFGSPKSTFMLVYEPFIITTSCLDIATKKKLKTLMCVLGGHIVNEWRKDCSYLVMSSISVTIKVICAMVSLKHIILPEYIENLIRHLKDGKENPDPEKFLPQISDKQIDPKEVSFLPDPRRASVFQGMKFIFLNPKQFKKMSLTIELGGGLPVLMEEGSNNDDKLMIEPGSVVMQSDPTDNTQGFTQQGTEWISYVGKYLKKHKKFMIQDAELGFAVLYCSTEKHCNPNLDFVASQTYRLPSQSLSQVDVLVQNTEPGSRSPVVRGRDEPDVVNETKIERKNKSQTSKRETQKSETQSLMPEVQPDSEVSCPMQRKKRAREEETVDEVTSVSKKIKQEKVTPVKVPENTTLRRSPRRSPSPVSISSVKTENNDANQTSPSSGKTNTNLKTVKKEIDFVCRATPSQGPLMDSVKREPVTGSKSPKSSERSKSKVKGQTGVVDTQLGTDLICLDSDSENETVNNSTGWTNVTLKSSKDKRQGHDEDNISKSDKSESKDVKRRGKREIIEDSDDDIKPHRHKRTRKEIDDDDDDDDDDKIGLGKRSKNRHSKMKDVDLFEVPDTGNAKRPSEVHVESEIRNRCTERGNTLSPKKGSVSIKQETEDDYSGAVIVNQEDEANTFLPAEQPGYLNTGRASEKNSVKSEYLEEEDMPSKCVVTKFIDLVARKPRSSEESNGDGDEQVPAGYTRWKGKLVKNFKKFRKAEHAGAGGLPRIIGGSDLEAHFSSARKEIDDFFREAMEVESQQNDADRKAQELFDYEPKAAASKNRGR